MYSLVKSRSHYRNLYCGLFRRPLVSAYGNALEIPLSSKKSAKFQVFCIKGNHDSKVEPPLRSTGVCLGSTVYSLVNPRSHYRSFALSIIPTPPCLGLREVSFYTCGRPVAAGARNSSGREKTGESADRIGRSARFPNYYADSFCIRGADCIRR